MKTLEDVAQAMPTLEAAVGRACDWLADTAQIKGDRLTIEQNRLGLAHENWRGAFRGEYTVATRTWDFFCPTWHGGQAVKALAQGYQLLGDPRYLRSAQEGAEFILRQQIASGADEGLILAYEGIADKVYVSAILESLDGLLVLARASNQRKYTDAALRAAAWCYQKARIGGEGLVRDLYDPATRDFVENDDVVTKANAPGRPLADDAIWLKAAQLSGDERYRTFFYEILHRLLTDERPAGNWVDYGPCLPASGECHPRHAYWWGLPMIDAWQDSRDEKWLDAARRSGEWYVKAQRNDGGLFRYTDLNFNTSSFGHATSGIACAAILWTRLFQETGETRWLEPLHRALAYCVRMQFVEPSDPNLKGCILEKVLEPDGTDRSPYYIRDLGTIFFAQAAAQLLLACRPSTAKTVEVSIRPRIDRKALTAAESRGRGAAEEVLR
jgi:hypothetical protein